MKKFFLFISIVFLLSLFICYRVTKSDGFVHLKFSAWGSQSEMVIIKDLISDFEKENPNIKVELIHIPQNYFQKLHLLFASNLAPDVVFINNYYAPKYVKAGLLSELTTYIEKEKFFDKAVKSFEFGGEIYAFPRDVSELVVYYNKDLFKKNGIKQPDAAWTISDFKKIASILSKDTNGDGKNDVWGVGYETDSLYWLPFLMSNGTGILSDNGMELLIRTNKALKILEEYADMANKYNIAPTKSQSASLTMAQLFLQEKIAMQISGRWLTPKYREEAGFDWDVACFPSGSAGSVMNIDASGYAVSKASKYQEEAVSFIKFMTSEKSINKLAQSGLIVPALKKSAYSDDFLARDKKPKNSTAFVKTVENGKPTIVSDDYQHLTDKLNRALEPLFLGQKSGRRLYIPDIEHK